MGGTGPQYSIGLDSKYNERRGLTAEWQVGLVAEKLLRESTTGKGRLWQKQPNMILAKGRSRDQTSPGGGGP